MEKIILISIFVVFLSLKIIFSTKGVAVLKNIFTPLTTISIILLPLLFLYNNHSTYAVLITAALIFSLVGDIFNMFEDGENIMLQYSSLFFLFTHIIYIYLFSRCFTFAFHNLFLILFMLGVLIFTYLLTKANISSLIFTLTNSFYIISASLTMFFAIASLNTVVSARTILISIGSSLFWLSDIFLGIHSYRKKLKLDSLIIWGLYAPGQLLIALSCFY